MTGALLVTLVLAAGNPSAHGTSLFPRAHPDVDARGVSIEHPRVALVDGAGNPVVQSGNAASAMRTCGACHDTDYIAAHSYHASAGSDEMSAHGTVSGGRAWDTSPGWFGRWNPLTYRVLTTNPEGPIDMGTADWVRTLGTRHPGGGPAARAGRDARVLDPITGDAAHWDWDRSGTAEFDCFLCHIATPDPAARARALGAGRFEWASTASLEKTGLVTATADGWRWNRDAFDGDTAPLAITAPTSSHCGACHGLVHEGTDPVLPRYGLGEYATDTEGQIFAWQRIAASGMNIAGKDALSRPWDVHAERLLECTSCHYAPNNPAYASEDTRSRPGHLDFDGRRQDIAEFLKRPNHDFVKGHSAQGTVADHLDATMRGCDDCHDAVSTHAWLPYTGRHMDRLRCESCHVPRVYAPARSTTDWTVLTATRGPRVEYRGIDGDVGDPRALIDGFRPALLSRVADGDDARLAPYNLIASWYWVSGDPPRPVRLWDLERAFFGAAGSLYRGEIVAALDSDGDGNVSAAELVLDTPEKVDAVRARLEAVGVDSPRVEAELQPIGLHHGVAPGTWATRACDDCHSKNSIVTARFPITSRVPGGVLPRLVGDAGVGSGGAVVANADGSADYVPASMNEGFYVLGHDRWHPGDTAGVVVIFAVVLGVFVHGGLRYRVARRNGRVS